jgi:hypothetical protein
MWLWYLELYAFALAAFALGAVSGLLLVRLAVRRTADDPALGAQQAGSPGTKPGAKAGPGPATHPVTGPEAAT